MDVQLLDLHFVAVGLMGWFILDPRWNDRAIMLIVLRAQSSYRGARR